MAPFSADPRLFPTDNSPARSEAASRQAGPRGLFDFGCSKPLRSRWRRWAEKETSSEEAHWTFRLPLSRSFPPAHKCAFYPHPNTRRAKNCCIQSQLLWIFRSYQISLVKKSLGRQNESNIAKSHGETRPCFEGRLEQGASPGQIPSHPHGTAPYASIDPSKSGSVSSRQELLPSCGSPCYVKT